MALEHHGPSFFNATHTGMAGGIPGQQAVHLATAVVVQALRLALRILFKEGTQVGLVADVDHLLPLQRQKLERSAGSRVGGEAIKEAIVHCGQQVPVARDRLRGRKDISVKFTRINGLPLTLAVLAEDGDQGAAMGAAAVLGKQHFRATVVHVQLHHLHQGVGHGTGQAHVLQQGGIRQQADGCVLPAGGRPEPEHGLLLLTAVPIRLDTKRQVRSHARCREAAA